MATGKIRTSVENIHRLNSCESGPGTDDIKTVSVFGVQSG
jgi:hypothetical protein